MNSSSHCPSFWNPYMWTVHYVLTDTHLLGSSPSLIEEPRQDALRGFSGLNALFSLKCETDTQTETLGSRSGQHTEKLTFYLHLMYLKSNFIHADVWMKTRIWITNKCIYLSFIWMIESSQVNFIYITHDDQSHNLPQGGLQSSDSHQAPKHHPFFLHFFQLTYTQVLQSSWYWRLYTLNIGFKNWPLSAPIYCYPSPKLSHLNPLSACKGEEIIKCWLIDWLILYKTYLWPSNNSCCNENV